MMHVRVMIDRNGQHEVERMVLSYAGKIQRERRRSNVPHVLTL